MTDLIKNNITGEGVINENALLFRITSPSYATKGQLLDGMGAYYANGRFNVLHQRTAYVANNILLCISEKLFHMYHESMEALENTDFRKFYAKAYQECILVFFKSQEVNDLVCLDSTQIFLDNSMNPSVLTHPGFIHPKLKSVANNYRSTKKGLIYPSARHSCGSALCLFGENHKRITLKKILRKIRIKLSLVSDDQKTLVMDGLNPGTTRISSSVGYYKIDARQLNVLRNQGFDPKPKSIKDEGLIRFHREFYNASYPDDVYCQ